MDRKTTRGFIMAGITAVVVAAWAIGHFRIPGTYSHCAHAVEPFGGSFLTHLQLHGDGTGEMWQKGNTSTDFKVSLTWTDSKDEIDVTVPQWTHWSYSYFNAPGRHRFLKTGARLQAVGTIDDGAVTLYGTKRGMAPKVFVFRKDILQF